MRDVLVTIFRNRIVATVSVAGLLFSSFVVVDATPRLVNRDTSQSAVSEDVEMDLMDADVTLHPSQCRSRHRDLSGPD